MKYLLLFTTLLFAGELEVDGDLTVLGNVNAPGLGGMKPERIYNYIRSHDGEPFSFSVPSEKLWIIVNGGSSNTFNIDEKQVTLSNTSSFGLLPLQTISSPYDNSVTLTIYEYSISGSGTSQGMDYVEP